MNLTLPEDVRQDQLVVAQECVEAAGETDAENSEECQSPSGHRTYAEVARLRMDEDVVN